MTKYIVTGVDGNFGGYVARNITKLTDKENLIFTCPFEEGLKGFKDEGFDVGALHLGRCGGGSGGLSVADHLLLR